MLVAIHSNTIYPREIVYRACIHILHDFIFNTKKIHNHSITVYDKIYYRKIVSWNMQNFELIERFLLPSNDGAQSTSHIELYVKKFQTILKENFDLKPTTHWPFFFYLHVAALVTLSNTGLFDKFKTSEVTFFSVLYLTKTFLFLCYWGCLSSHYWTIYYP